MSLNIANISEYERVIQDDLNPRIYSREYKCVGCNTWISDEETIWCDGFGFLTIGDEGKPYCVSCCPEQPDYNKEN